jgi:hypothetical protein
MGYVCVVIKGGVLISGGWRIGVMVVKWLSVRGWVWFMIGFLGWLFLVFWGSSEQWIVDK